MSKPASKPGAWRLALQGAFGQGVALALCPRDELMDARLSLEIVCYIRPEELSFPVEEGTPCKVKVVLTDEEALEYHALRDRVTRRVLSETGGLAD